MTEPLTETAILERLIAWHCDQHGSFDIQVWHDAHTFMVRRREAGPTLTLTDEEAKAIGEACIESSELMLDAKAVIDEATAWMAEVKAAARACMDDLQKGLDFAAEQGVQNIATNNRLERLRAVIEEDTPRVPSVTVSGPDDLKLVRDALEDYEHDHLDGIEKLDIDKRRLAIRDQLNKALEVE